MLAEQASMQIVFICIVHMRVRVHVRYVNVHVAACCACLQVRGVFSIPLEDLEYILFK